MKTQKIDTRLICTQIVIARPWAFLNENISRSALANKVTIYILRRYINEDSSYWVDRNSSAKYVNAEAIEAFTIVSMR